MENKELRLSQNLVIKAVDVKDATTLIIKGKASVYRTPDGFLQIDRDQELMNLDFMDLDGDRQIAVGNIDGYNVALSEFTPTYNFHTEYLYFDKIPDDKFFQQFIFQPLGMNGSYINLKSSPIKNQLSTAKFYFGDIELSSIESLSADWGGGGLVATTQDLIKFFQVYNNDKIINKNTRLTMHNWVDETVGMEYGYGIRKVSFNDLYRMNTDLQLIGHTGSTASFLWYCPQLDTYIAGTLNQLKASKRTPNLVYDILKLIENK